MARVLNQKEHIISRKQAMLDVNSKRIAGKIIRALNIRYFLKLFQVEEKVQIKYCHADTT